MKHHVTTIIAIASVFILSGCGYNQAQGQQASNAFIQMLQQQQQMQQQQAQNAQAARSQMPQMQMPQTMTCHQGPILNGAIRCTSW